MNQKNKYDPYYREPMKIMMLFHHALMKPIWRLRKSLKRKKRNIAFSFG